MGATRSPLPDFSGEPLIQVFDLGLAPYLETQQLQGRLRREVARGRRPGTLLLLEHPPVITLGSRGGPGDLRGDSAMTAEHVTVVRSERGGAATLHAPGQLVSYPIMPIPGRDLRRFVSRLEEVLIRLLTEWGIEARRHPGKPGLYVSADKIASVGLRCERWVSSHGTSLNVSVDLALFELIVSCGERELQQTSVAALTETAPPMERVKQAYAERFAEVFQVGLTPLCSASLESFQDEL